MRLALEALLIIGGSLTLFAYSYRQILNMRRRNRVASFEDRRREDEYLDDQLHGRDN